MKTSVLTGITLTLIMLLLVMLAAFLFLFQGRQALEQRAEIYLAEADGLEDDLTSVQAELDAAGKAQSTSVASLATAESDAVLLEGQLVASQQKVDELSAQADVLSSELAAANESVSQLEQQQELAAQQPPQVRISAPMDGAVYVPGEPIPVIAAASDAVGIAAVSLTVNDEPIKSYDVEDEPLFSVSTSWSAETTGSFVIGAMAANSNGLTSSLITVTIQVIDVEARNLSILAQTEANVSGLRGLPPQAEAEIEFASEDAAQQPGVGLGFSNQEASIGRDVLTLAALDFVSPDFPLSQTLFELQTAMHLTDHDPLQKQFIFTPADGSLNAAEKWAYVHGFAHVLQDQHYQLIELRGQAEDEDAAAAVEALIEGDAELVASLYLNGGYLSDDELAQITPGVAYDEAALLEVYPAVLVDQLAFPRIAGFAFAQELYDQGNDSFSLIEDAWNEPPHSTEQILHPERYLAGDVPSQVSLPDLAVTLGNAWEIVEEGRMGEFLLRQYLQQQLSQEQAESAAEGWGGDQYAVYWSDTQEALLLVLWLAWDTVEDSSEFAAIYPNYPTRMYGVSGELHSNGGECWAGSDAICFYPSGERALIVRAPDVDTAVSVAEAFEISN